MKYMFNIKYDNYIIVIVFSILILAGCKNKYDFNGTWIRNENTVVETIYFGEDGHFSYYTSEGKAVGDYDLCYSYKYSKKDNEIILKCDRDFDEWIKNSVRKNKYQKVILMIKNILWKIIT